MGILFHAILSNCRWSYVIKYIADYIEVICMLAKSIRE